MRHLVIMIPTMVWILSFSLPSLGKSDSPVNTPMPEYDVIVIGAGGGGLSAAARLSLAGKKVLVIEQHDRVGGYMTRFEREPYAFEVSLHAFDGLDPEGFNHRIFEKLGIMDKVKPVRLDPLYRSQFPHFALDVPADPDAYLALLKERFPHEKDGFDNLFNAMGHINKVMQGGMYIANGEYGKGFMTSLKHIRSFLTFFKYRDAALSDFLDDYLSDPEAKTVFSQLTGFLGDQPDKVSGMVFAIMWNSYHRNGYYYFEGGSQSVSDALAAVIEENGGTILLNHLVTKIIVEKGRVKSVQTRDGKVFGCRYAVSNANAGDTFLKLVGKEHLPESYLEKLESLKPGISCFMVYLGVDYDYTPLFPENIHEIFYNPGVDQVENYTYVRDVNIEKMPFALTNYSMVDATACPKGKNVICLTTIMPYGWKDGWYENESYGKYTALKQEVADVLIKRAEKMLPGLGDHIEEMETGSPRTMEHYTLNTAGSILGWDNTPDQTMLKRLPQKTPIKNLYLAGAWTFPSGGQSAVIMSGLMAAEKILKQE